jgi:VRR-NUC domain
MRATIPFLSLAMGRKPRARKVPPPKEIVLQTTVAKVLREHCLPSWQWTHIASGELRDIRTAMKLKRMGLRPGWPDFVLVPPTGQMHCLELKRMGEKLTDEQEAFQTWCIANAVPHAVAFTFDHALAVLDSWGCLRLRFTGKVFE